MSDSQPVATFAEIRSLISELPGPDLEAGTAATVRQRDLVKPAGSLGRLEELAVWLATWQGRHPPDLRRPRVSVFAGNHGIAAHGVSAYPASVTATMVQTFIDGGGAVNQLADLADADLRVYELDLDRPTADFTAGPAMTEEDCARAMAYGMMSVEAGLHVVALGEMGIGNTTAAAALSAALFGGPAEAWTGRGSGIDEAGLARKVAVVAAGLAANTAAAADPLEALRRLGGYELAAVAGAVLAARLARTPVILDGFAATAAAAVLHKLDRHALDHCLIAHRSAEPGHARLLDILDKQPLFDFAMHLGEASGAALAIPILKAAVACHTNMATFAETGIGRSTDTSRPLH